MKKHLALTLLEICLATLVFIVALIGILLFYFNTQEFNELASSFSVALNEAKKMMEVIRSTQFSDIYATYNNYRFDPEGFSSGLAKGIVYIDKEAGRDDLLRVNVVICFRAGRRIIGEDLDLDGVLDSGEDRNGNGRLDSPVELTTLVTSRY
ncbi:MAG: hypothetical protein B6D55_07830 [Candidatus Omnitrophica bacterium 4484_70.2]|nr:MAG: hypothetical protein B6D55_07830 [Candidatus Omnitrophica bacterium 4484_70.2]